MRAAKNERIGALINQGAHVLLNNAAGLRRVKFTCFDLLHQSRARDRDHPVISGEALDQALETIRCNGPCCSEHPDNSVFCHPYSRFDGGLDTDHGEWELCSQPVNGCGCRGVAGHDNRLHAVGCEKSRDLHNAVFNPASRAVAPGSFAAVTGKKEVLKRKGLTDFPQDRQTAETGIQGSDRKRWIPPVIIE